MVSGIFSSHFYILRVFLVYFRQQWLSGLGPRLKTSLEVPPWSSSWETATNSNLVRSVFFGHSGNYPEIEFGTSWVNRERQDYWGRVERDNKGDP